MGRFVLRKNQRFRASVPVLYSGNGVAGEGMAKDLSLSGGRLGGMNRSLSGCFWYCECFHVGSPNHCGSTAPPCDGSRVWSSAWCSTVPRVRFWIESSESSPGSWTSSSARLLAESPSQQAKCDELRSSREANNGDVLLFQLRSTRLHRSPGGE